MIHFIVKPLATLLSVATLSLAARAQFEQDPTAGITHSHDNSCSWDYTGAIRGDRSLEPVPVSGKPNEKTQKRVRYIRAGTGHCGSVHHTEACPCSFERLEEVEYWYERTIKEVEYTYIESTDVIPHVAGIDSFPGAKAAFDVFNTAKKAALKSFSKQVKTRTVYGDWSALPPVHKLKDICLCDGKTATPASVPGTGGVTGYPNPGSGIPRGAANPTTGGPSNPPAFEARPQGTVSGNDIPVPGTGPHTGGAPNVPPDQLPAIPICTAGNDVPDGRFHWDYKRDHEWQETYTPAYIAFERPGCIPSHHQDRYKWIRRVTMTGTLEGAASCSAKPDGHAGHPECAGGCSLGGYPTNYRISWFRDLTFEPVQDTIKCSVGLPDAIAQFGSVEQTMTGTVGWKPVFGPWQVEVGGGLGDPKQSCGCTDHKEDEEEPKEDPEEGDAGDESNQEGGG